MSRVIRRCSGEANGSVSAMSSSKARAAFTKQGILAFELVDVISQKPRDAVSRSLRPTGLHVMHLVPGRRSRADGSSPTSSSKKRAMSV